MDNDVRSEGSCTRKITITVPAAEVDAEYKKMLRGLSMHIDIPGFRRGKAPLGMLEKRYGDGVKSDLAEEFIKKGYSEAVKEHDLVPLVPPKIEGDARLVPGSDFVVVLSVDVKPDVELREYKGIPLVRKVEPVVDADVDKAEKELLESGGNLQPVEDRASRVGDFTLVEFEAEGVPLKHVLKLDDTVTVALLDHVVGDVVEGHFEFPPDWPDSGLAGNIYDAKVKIIELKELVPTEIDEEFLKQFGEDVTDEQKLRDKIREDLEKSRRDAAERELRKMARDELAARNPIDLSDRIVDMAVDDTMKRYWDVEKMTEEQSDEIRKGLRPNTIRSMTADFVIDKIVAVEGITVTSDEIKKRVAEIARANNLQPDALYRHWRKEGRIDSLRDDMLAEKAIDLVVENANIIEE